MRIVLDTNVYVAAFLKKSLASKILKYGQSGKVKLFTSEKIISETKKVLKNKFNVDRVRITIFINAVTEFVQIVEPKEKLNIVKEDPDDNVILECAVEAEADLIVTMDKHLLDLKSYGKTGIIHPKTLTWVLPKILENN